jgi:hypothetical protein
MDSVMEQSNATCAAAVPVIGKMLLAGEYIVPQDLEFALEHQRHSQEPLGEILVRMGALEREELEKVLFLQGTLCSR